MSGRIKAGLVASLVVITAWGAQGLYGERVEPVTPTPVVEEYCRALPQNFGTRCDSDGRLHPCGWVTPDGVTEYIDSYTERCGDLP